MAAVPPTTNLTTFPIDVFVEHIVPRLSLQDIQAWGTTCKTTWNDFRDPGVLNAIYCRFSPQSVGSDFDFPARRPGEAIQKYKTRCWNAYVGLANRTWGSQVLTGHTDTVRSVAFAPDGRIATGSNDNTARVYSPQGQLLRELTDHTAGVTSIAFAPDGRFATASYDNTARVYSPEGEFLCELTGHTNAVKSVAFAPDGRIATASDDNTARVYSPQGQLLCELTGHTDAVTSVAFAPDGQFATGSWDNTARVYSPQGQLLYMLRGHTHAVTSVAFAPDGRFATASYDNTARVYSPEGKFLCELTDHTDTVTSVAFAPDGRFATASYDNTARVHTPFVKKYDKVLQEISEQLAGTNGNLIQNAMKQFAKKEKIPRQMRMEIADALYCARRLPLTGREVPGWADTGWPRLIEGMQFIRPQARKYRPTYEQRADAINSCLPLFAMDAYERLEHRIRDRIYCLADVGELSSVYFRCEPGIISCEQHTMHIEVGLEPNTALQMIWRPDVQVKNKHGRLVGRPRPGWVLPPNIQINPRALTDEFNSWDYQFFRNNNDKEQIGATLEFRRFAIPDFAFEESPPKPQPKAEIWSEPESEERSASRSASASDS